MERNALTTQMTSWKVSRSPQAPVLRCHLQGRKQGLLPFPNIHSKCGSASIAIAVASWIATARSYMAIGSAQWTSSPLPQAPFQPDLSPYDSSYPPIVARPFHKSTTTSAKPFLVDAFTPLSPACFAHLTLCPDAHTCARLSNSPASRACVAYIELSSIFNGSPGLSCLPIMAEYHRYRCRVVA